VTHNSSTRRESRWKKPSRIFSPLMNFIAICGFWAAVEIMWLHTRGKYVVKIAHSSARQGSAGATYDGWIGGLPGCHDAFTLN
jgi:hypothetical protein